MTEYQYIITGACIIGFLSWFVVWSIMDMIQHKEKTIDGFLPALVVMVNIWIFAMLWLSGA